MMLVGTEKPLNVPYTAYNSAYWLSGFPNRCIQYPVRIDGILEGKKIEVNYSVVVVSKLIDRTKENINHEFDVLGAKVGEEVGKLEVKISCTEVV